MPVKRYNGSSWDVVAGDGVAGAPGANGTNGIDASPYASGKNRIINGDFGIWQRGTSGFANGAFTADRMLSDNAATASRSTDAPSGFTYSMRWTTPGATNCVIRHGIELPAAGAQGIFYDGATFTFSIYAKSSVAGKNLTLYMAFADGTNGTARRTVVDNIVIGTTTTSWARYTHTFAIPAGAAISPAVCLQVTPYVTAPNADVYMTGMQLEAGSVATPFTTATGTIQGELEACQRYCIKFTPATNNGYERIGVSLGTNSSGQSILIHLPVEMRTYPSSMTTSGSFAVWNANMTTVSSLALSTTPGTHKSAVFLSATGNSNGFNYFHFYAANTSTDYMLFSAEL